MGSIDFVIHLSESIRTSLENREKASYYPAPEDSNASIKRRITVIREELLKLSKSL